MYFNLIKQFDQDIIELKYGKIIKHPLVQRLKDISFLGTLDILNNLRRKYSRYDHSVGVAYLAYLAAKKLGLSQKEKEILLVASLLHDIGHAPLSHASEPFLLEHLSRPLYHEGRTHMLLRFLADTIDSITGSFKEIQSLITGTNKNGILQSLFGEAICLDNLDGTNRTAFSLRIPIVDPTEIIDSMYLRGGEVYFPYKKISLLSKFCQLETFLYTKYIYNQRVLAAEAMLTRALELTFTDKDAIQQFIYNMRDREVWKKLLQNEYSALLVKMLKDSAVFKSLTHEDPFYSQELFSQYKKAQFNYKQRKKVESIVAKKYSVFPIFVIFHFSHIREFKDALVHHPSFLQLQQDVPLTRVLKSYERTRRPAARVDVFFPDRHINNQLVFPFYL